MSEVSRQQSFTLPKITQKSSGATSSNQRVNGLQDDQNNDIEFFLNTTMSAAGVPVFEIIRRLEEENSLTKEDRYALNLALYDPNRSELIIKAFQEVELGANSKFALRRLKIILHQNNAGDPSIAVRNNGNENINDNQISLLHWPFANGNQGQPNAQKLPFKLDVPDSDIDSINQETVDTQSQITKVVGNDPLYSGVDGPNACAKLARNLQEFIRKNRNSSSRWGSRKFGVIVGSGSFNPLTRMHLRTFHIAKQCLERSTDITILGSLLSPTHSSIVRERYRTCPSEIMPSPHRLAIAQLAVEESKWLSVDPWEITRRRGMDHLSLLEHVALMMKNNFPDNDIRVLFLCKANMVPKLSPTAFRKCNYGIVCVCRAPESDQLLESLGSRWKGLLFVAEDTAIVDAAMATVSSRKVRDKLKAGEPVEQLVGDTVATYFRAHRIGSKMAGTEEWEEAEKQMPKMTSGNGNGAGGNNNNNNNNNNSNNGNNNGSNNGRPSGSAVGKAAAAAGGGGGVLPALSPVLSPEAANSGVNRVLSIPKLGAAAAVK